jgi:hypothetical protein
MMCPASGVLRLGWSFTTLSAAHREMHSRPQPQEQVTSQRGRGGRIFSGPGTTLEGFRSSPFLSPASALQDFIFSCWGTVQPPTFPTRPPRVSRCPPGLGDQPPAAHQRALTA